MKKMIQVPIDLKDMDYDRVVKLAEALAAQEIARQIVDRWKQKQPSVPPTRFKIQPYTQPINTGDANTWTDYFFGKKF